MASFLKIFDALGIDLLKGISIVGPTVAGAAATAAGGPLAGSMASAIVGSIVMAERAHLAQQTAAPPAEPVQPPAYGTPDPRKLAVTQNVMVFLPVIEAFAAALGHPVPDRARFEVALPAVIDNTVAGFNAWAEILAALHSQPRSK